MIVIDAGDLVALTIIGLVFLILGASYAVAWIRERFRRIP